MGGITVHDCLDICIIASIYNVYTVLAIPKHPCVHNSYILQFPNYAIIITIQSKHRLTKHQILLFQFKFAYLMRQNNNNIYRPDIK